MRITAKRIAALAASALLRLLIIITALPNGISTRALAFAGTAEAECTKRKGFFGEKVYANGPMMALIMGMRKRVLKIV